MQEVGGLMNETIEPIELNEEIAEPESVIIESTIPISQIAQELQGLSFWLRLLSVIGYIGVVVVLLFVVGMFILGLSESGMLDTSAILAMIPVLAVVSGLIWFYLTLMNLLSQGSESLKKAETNQSTQSIKEFFYCIRRFFKMSGIFALIYLGLVIAVALLSLLLPKVLGT